VRARLGAPEGTSLVGKCLLLCLTGTLASDVERHEGVNLPHA